MQISRRIALDVQDKAVGHAEKGKFSGVVASLFSNPSEIMTMAMLPNFLWDTDTGLVTAIWSDEGTLNTTPFEIHLKSIASVYHERERLRLGERALRDVRHVLIMASQKGSLLAEVDLETFNSMDWPTLETYAKAFKIKYSGCEHYTGSLDWESPSEELVRMKFVPL